MDKKPCDNKVADELGVNVRIAAIQQSKAYKEMADGKPWDKLSTNMQRTILYYHILESVNANLGDSLQYNTQLQMARFTASLQDVRMALGAAFLPILNVILPVLTTFMRWLETGLKYVYAFSKAIIEAFGGKVGKLTSPLKSATASTQGLANATQGASDNADDLAKKTKAVGKAAKQAAKDGANLQSFDQVHLMDAKDSGASDSGGGGGGGGGGGVGAVAPPPDPTTFDPLKGVGSIFDDVGKSVDRLATKFKNWLKTSEGIKTLKQGLKDVLQGFQDIYNSKGVQWFIKAFVEDLPDFFDSLGTIGGGVLKLIGGKLEEIGGFLDGDMSKSWKGWGDQLSGLWDIASGTVGLIFPDLGKKMDGFGNKFDKGWGEMGKLFVDGSDNWGQVWDKFTTGLKLKFGGKVGAMTLDGISKFGDLKQKTTKSVGDSVVDFIGKYTSFGKSTKSTLDWIQKNHGSIMEGIKAITKKKMEDAYTEFKKPFAGVGAWWEKHVTNPMHDALKNVNKGLDGAFGDGVRTVYNRMAKRINGMLGGLASIGTDGFYPFSGITRYAIPPLAKGGITQGPLIAQIGDNPGGHEVVAPLDTLRGMIANTMIDVLRASGGSGSGDIVLNIDGRTFARLVKPHIDKENKRVGNNIRLNPI